MVVEYPESLDSLAISMSRVQAVLHTEEPGKRDPRESTVFIVESDSSAGIPAMSGTRGAQLFNSRYQTSRNQRAAFAGSVGESEPIGSNDLRHRLR